MEANALLGPLLGMMALTMAVWIYMYIRRIHYSVVNRIDPQRLTTPEKAAAIIPEEINNSANNLKNLFELPVLFYALCLYLYVTGSVDWIYVSAAWAFVAFRALHSLVHCTSNHVMNRFRLYMIASLALWAMLIRALLEYLA